MPNEPYTECWDCKTELSARDAVTITVTVDGREGGYERIDVPACPRCRLKHHGHACDHCGSLHEDIESAARCCVGSTKAPDCRECGRRMSIGARGFSPVRGHDITWAECECCPIGWGRFTGWSRLDGQCKHVAATDGGHRLSTDRVDGKLFARCPNKENLDDNHFLAEVEYTDAKPDTLPEEFIEAFPECGECGEEASYLSREDPSEVLD